MVYTYKRTRENGDATSNYEIIGEFPVTFIDFFKWVLENDNSFRITFSATNECYGGCFGNTLTAHNKDGRWYWEKKDPDYWFDEICRDKITGCWANGGYGQMTYYCTFEE